MSSHLQTKLDIQTNPDLMPGLADAWEKSIARSLFYCTSYEDYHSLQFDHCEDNRRVVVLTIPDGRQGFLPFLRERHLHKFKIGERRVGAMPFVALRLVNPFMVEDLPAASIAVALQHVLRVEKVDLLALGEIPEDSSLQNALAYVSWPAKRLAIGRQQSFRWLVNLPQTFDEYMAGLSAGTRQSVKRKIRSLERNFVATLETVSTPDQVNRFLEEGEKISQLTYQWHVGQRLTNDVATQTRYRHLAEQGRLRCYLMLLDGTPRAFLRGTLEHELYHYETPGFDPEFRKTSIGTIILMEAFKDLISNTNCRTFDFGTGGDQTGYKSIFGTDHIICNSYYVLSLYRLPSLVILALESALNGVKNLANKVVPQGNFRNHIKRRLRKYGGQSE